jgi:hypothetical protein
MEIKDQSLFDYIDKELAKLVYFSENKKEYYVFQIDVFKLETPVVFISMTHNTVHRSQDVIIEIPSKDFRPVTLKNELNEGYSKYESDFFNQSKQYLFRELNIMLSNYRKQKIKKIL